MSKSLRWFGPKRIGWGIRPIHPMGYLVLVLTIAGLIFGFHLITVGASQFFGIMFGFFSILFFIVVAVLTFDR